MRSLLRGTGLLLGVIATITLFGACEEWVEPPGRHYQEYPPEEPEPEPPLSVVSFVTLGHSTTAGRTVLLTIKLSPPAAKALSVRFVGHLPPFSYDNDGHFLIDELFVSVPKGASKAFVPVPLPYDPDMAGETRGISILIARGDGYVPRPPLYHGIRVTYDPNFDPEPDPEYAKEPHPLYNKEDDRCPYRVTMKTEGSLVHTHPVLLLDRVSTAGTLCATGTYNVQPRSLDRVSRASTAMLQQRPDIAERLTGKYVSGEFLLLYAESEYDWCDPPAFPEFYMNTLRECDRLRFSTPAGIFSKPIILCPESNLRICIHEIAHAVYFHVNEREPVQRRFNEPDVAGLWSGYAMEDHWEFFAEMSAVYFCVPTDDLTLPVKHCASELREYDPATYEVIHAIYRGSMDLRQVLR